MNKIKIVFTIFFILFSSGLSLYLGLNRIWSYMMETRAYQIESEVLSLIYNDLMERNLFKMGQSLAGLRKTNHIQAVDLFSISTDGAIDQVFSTSDYGVPSQINFINNQTCHNSSFIKIIDNQSYIQTSMKVPWKGVQCLNIGIRSIATPDILKQKRFLFGIMIFIAFFFNLILLLVVLLWVRHINKIIEINRQHQMNKNESMAQIAAQVSHDIRSPLSALEMVLNDLGEIPEENRVLIRDSVYQIKNIANGLLDKRREFMSGDKFQSDVLLVDQNPVLVGLVIDQIVSEKRTILKRKKDVEISFQLRQDNFSLFSKLSEFELKRVVSNLIDNALEVTLKGDININVFSDGEFNFIDIEDRGNGFPQVILNNFDKRISSFGKKKGNGLGLTYACQKAVEWGGKFEIVRSQSNGSTVRLSFPNIDRPYWFKSSIDIDKNNIVVVIDDDSSIHSIWERRLSDINFSKDQIIHFYNSQDFMSWREKNELNQITLLCDYELIGDDLNGLDIIKKGQDKNCYLVTSHYEDLSIQEECERHKIGLVPKSVARLIPLERRDEYDNYEYILIDDNRWIRRSWEKSGLVHRVNLKLFADPNEFFENAEKINFSKAKLFIDSELGDLYDKGEVIAKEINKRFKPMEIFLSTGHQKDLLPSMPWIKEVVGKMPPWEKIENDIAQLY